MRVTEEDIRLASRAWRAQIVAGAVLICASVIGAQFTTRDFDGIPWATLAVGTGVPLAATLGLFLVCAPPAGRRPILAIVGPLAAAVAVALFFLRFPRDAAENVVHPTIFGCAVLAGVASWLHVANVLRAARRRAASAAFALLACLILVDAVLYLIRYGYRRGIVANFWYFTVPGVGERVGPFGFALDWLIRPQVELNKFLSNPLWAAYLIVTVATPILCFALMIYLMAWRVRR